MLKRFSETGKEGSFFEKIPNLKATFGFEEKEQPRLFDRLFMRIRKMFSNEDTPSLKGRVEEMFPKIDSIYTKLTEIKKTISIYSSKQEELKAFIDLIIEPLIDQGHLLKQQRQVSDPFHQVKVLDLYQIWLDRAEFWIDSYQNTSKDSFYRLVNENIWKDFSSKVERDLQIIQDYIEHTVATLLVSEVDRSLVKVAIVRNVSKHLIALADLKKLPKEITFKDLKEWNRSIDSERQHHFEESLSLIDKEIDNAKPRSSLDEHQHLIDVIALLNSLEEQTLHLKHRFGVLDPTSAKEREAIEKKAQYLAQETHKLFLDLRISSPIVERLEEIQTILNEIQKGI